MRCFHFLLFTGLVFFFSLISLNAQAVYAPEFPAKLKEKIQKNLSKQPFTNPVRSPGKTNRPQKLSKSFWKCPISHETLKILELPSVLPEKNSLVLFYSPLLNLYWTRVLTEKGEIWGGPFQVGLIEDPVNQENVEQPTLQKIKHFIQAVMVDEAEGGTGFFENQFLGIKELGPQTLIHLDALIRDPLQDEEFQLLCCRAMGELGDKQAIPLLKSYLNDPFIGGRIRQEAIYTLAELGERSIIDRLIENYLKVLKNPILTPFQKTAIYTQLATMYYRLKEFDKSIECYQRCIQINPTKITYYNLACMYSKLGQVDKAIENLRLSIEEGYEEVTWMKKDGDLENLRNDPRFIEMVKKLTKKKEKKEAEQTL